MTFQHVYRFVGCLCCFGMGVGAHMDGLSFGTIGFIFFTGYIAYLVATAEVEADGAERSDV